MLRNLLRRKNLWINTGLQLRIILYCMLSSMAIGIFVAWAEYALLWHKITQFAATVEGSRMSPVELFPAVWQEIMPWIIAVFVLVLLCAVGIGLIISHQIAGPLYRLKLAFTDIGTGKLGTRVKLRTFDGLKDVADLLNDSVAAIQSRDIKRSQLLKAAEEALMGLPKQLDQEIRLNAEQQEKVQKARSLLEAETVEMPKS